MEEKISSRLFSSLDMEHSCDCCHIVCSTTAQAGRLLSD